MLFNSLKFIVFFPAVILLYFVVPKKARAMLLLIASYVFYMGWDAKYALLIATSTLITYTSGLLFSIIDDKKKLMTDNQSENLLSNSAFMKKYNRRRKLIVALSFISNLGILFVFKYFNFFIGNINSFLSVINASAAVPELNLVLPVGISFYTFQALSYTVDVYRGNIEPEKSIINYALFVSFFPQLVAGPIERSDNLLRQVRNVDKLNIYNYKNIISGLTIMLWGYFLKMVIADRISKLADFALSGDNIWANNASVLIIGIIAFSIQIYCDFASYSTIAIGAAKVMGFSLMENFNTPYFAVSIKDFWNRWHISLSTWFRDYLYIPLGGNRKGKLRKYFNLTVVFLVSGLWHGASWTFVIWGLIHAFYQIIGDVTAPSKRKIEKKLNIETEKTSYKLMKMIITFSLVNFAWIFFRAETMSDAILIISRIFTNFDLWAIANGVIYEMGLSVQEINILAVALCVMFAVDVIKYRYNKRIDEFLNSQNLIFRWAVMLFLLIYILIYGSYGPAFDAQSFIYFQF